MRTGTARWRSEGARPQWSLSPHALRHATTGPRPTVKLVLHGRRSAGAVHWCVAKGKADCGGGGGQIGGWPHDGWRADGVSRSELASEGAVGGAAALADPCAASTRALHLAPLIPLCGLHATTLLAAEVSRPQLRTHAGPAPWGLDEQSLGLSCVAAEIQTVSGGSKNKEPKRTAQASPSPARPAYRPASQPRCVCVGVTATMARPPRTLMMQLSNDGTVRHFTLLRLLRLLGRSRRGQRFSTQPTATRERPF